MNIFRLCGDMSHVFSIIVLLLRLRVAKNASGELRGRIRRFVFVFAFHVFVRLSLQTSVERLAHSTTRWR